MSEIVELLRQLVAIDSINPDLVPGGGRGPVRGREVRESARLRAAELRFK